MNATRRISVVAYVSRARPFGRNSVQFSVDIRFRLTVLLPLGGFNRSVQISYTGVPLSSNMCRILVSIFCGSLHEVEKSS